MAKYPSYLGVDISPEAINICRCRFAGDKTKSFVVADDYAGEKAELVLSLDVLYHLVEDSVFHSYMKSLFDSATRFVVIYSSNTDVQQKLQGQHVRHREFTDWITKNAIGWELLRHVPNIHPYPGGDNYGLVADFYIYRLASG